MADDLTRRVEVLEAAVLALGIEEFGDVDGHPFHGNQWSEGNGGGDDAAKVMGDRVFNHMQGIGPRPGKTPEENAKLDREHADKVVAYAKEKGITNWEDAKNRYNDAPYEAAQAKAFDRVREAAEDRPAKKGDIAVLKDGGFVKVGSTAKGYITGNGIDSSGAPVYHEDVRPDKGDVVGVINAKASQDTKNVDRWLRSNYDISVSDINWDNK